MNTKMRDEYLLYHSGSYGFLGARIAACLGFEAGTVERKRFPDGELYHRIQDDVRERDVVLVGGTVSDEETLEIYDLASALVKYGARTLTLVLPYFGYSTMERAVQHGEVVKAKNRARLFSSIPGASFGNRVVLIDLHSEGLPHYFEGSTVPVHLYAKDVAKASIKQAGGESFVLGCADAGRAKWVQSLANELGCEASFVQKKRWDGARTEVTAVSAQVRGRRVVIFDDMIRTGSSLIGAAGAYLAAGAVSTAAVATHGVLPDGALDKIRAAGVMDSLYCTDTHPRAVALQGEFLRISSVAELVARFLRGEAAGVY